MYVTVWTCWNLTFDRSVGWWWYSLCSHIVFQISYKHHGVSKISTIKLSPTLFKVHLLIYMSEGPYSLSQFTLNIPLPWIKQSKILKTFVLKIFIFLVIFYLQWNILAFYIRNYKSAINIEKRSFLISSW